MRHKDVHVGGHYRARISGHHVTVRLDRIEEREGYTRLRRHGSNKTYHCTNLRTGRKVVFRSAAKLRSEVSDAVTAMRERLDQLARRQNTTTIGPIRCSQCGAAVSPDPEAECHRCPRCGTAV